VEVVKWMEMEMLSSIVSSVTALYVNPNAADLACTDD